MRTAKGILSDGMLLALVAVAAGCTYVKSGGSWVMAVLAVIFSALMLFIGALMAFLKFRDERKMLCFKIDYLERERKHEREALVKLTKNLEKARDGIEGMGHMEIKMQCAAYMDVARAAAERVLMRLMKEHRVFSMGDEQAEAAKIEAEAIIEQEMTALKGIIMEEVRAGSKKS